VKHLITHGCAICGEPTQDALCGNRLLVGSDVSRLPTEQAPAVFWRCRIHQRYQLRQASAVRASDLGDLIYTLTCGHEVLGVFRGHQVYTPAKIKRGLLTRQIRLDQPQRCYACGDLERESESKP
jgi:hypothetical protein